MDAIFLGTASGSPTRARNVSGGALRLDDGRVWIVDCGEGTQHQILRSDLRPGRIAAILLTHLHGDHCFGLPGLLASLAVHGRSAPVQVVGPPGLERWLAVTHAVCHQQLGYPLTVTELAPEGGPVALAGEWAVEALPLVHRVPSYAYRFSEPSRRGRLDPARAAALGLAAGPELGRLAAGEPLQRPDGQVIAPDQVLGPPRPGRLVLWCGDSADSSALVGRAEDCDLLVHECTYAADRERDARRWGHSTTAMVAELAARLRPRHLVLNHLSGRYDAAGVAALRAEVTARCPGMAVTMAEDFLRVPVPAREA